MSVESRNADKSSSKTLKVTPSSSLSFLSSSASHQKYPQKERRREREARANGANNVSSHDDLSAAPLLQHQEQQRGHDMLASSSLKCVLAPSHFHSQAELAMWLAQLPKCHLHSVPLSQAIPASWATLTGHSVLDRVDGGRGVRGKEQAAAKVAQLQQHQLHQLLHPIQIMFHDELGD